MLRIETRQALYHGATPPACKVVVNTPFYSCRVAWNRTLGLSTAYGQVQFGNLLCNLYSDLFLGSLTPI
jgi:hypothetical protein